MTVLEQPFIILRPVVRAHPSPPSNNFSVDGYPIRDARSSERMPTMVDWAFAPEWLTPAQAAAPMGPAYSEDSILALVDLGAVDTKAGDALLIEKRSLYEYRESLWEVLTDEDYWYY